MTDETGYQPPEDLWEMDAALQFNEALDQDDPRYVDTSEARGDYSVRGLLRTLGVDDRDPLRLKLRTRHPRLYSVYCGHRGCGKSTELRRLAKRLNGSEVFFVVFLDALSELDYNNLKYADVLLALAKELFAALDRENISVEDVLLVNLRNWFAERVETNTKTREFAAEIKTGAKGEGGLPFLGKIFADITAALKSNSSYKEELRRIVENSFSQFAGAFNGCIVAAEDAIEKAGKGGKILFIVDGTDRLRDRDRERFFVGDVHQLKQIEANFIYCAPISLLYESNQVQQEFNAFILPMIKLHEKNGEEPLAEGYAVMKRMVYRRAHPKLFETPERVEKLIRFSGGSPRELFKLLHYAFLRSNNKNIDGNAVEAAIHDLATDFKRILNDEDYPLLRQIDSDGEGEKNSERIRHFLDHLIVLEYNGFWRKIHPAIQTLPEYKIAIESQKNVKIGDQTTGGILSTGDSSTLVHHSKGLSQTKTTSIYRLKVKNFTVFPEATFNFGPALNVIIGENSTGKSHLLKVIYSILFGIISEDENRTPENMEPEEMVFKMDKLILSKFINTFRPKSIGDLVRYKNEDCKIAFSLENEGGRLDLSFSKKNNFDVDFMLKDIPKIHPVFFPSREILSIFPNFVSLYDSRYLTFEENWKDLCILLGAPPLRKISPETQYLLSQLERAMGGNLELDQNGRFYLNTEEAGRIEIPLVAEGLRKLGMLARLLVTGAFSPRGYLLWDEPEASLNPRLIAELARILCTLSARGVQMFLATHSLFFLRELEILLSGAEFQDLPVRFFGLHRRDGGVIVEQGDSIDDVGDIAALDEQLAQSDRFMALES